MKEKTLNHGITLIALVITIIILLILAGIGILSLVGENGILTKVMKAEEETKKAQYKEQIELIISDKKIEKLQNPNNLDLLIKLVADAIEKEEWSKDVTICDAYGKHEIPLEECTKIIVETKDGYEIIVEIDNDLQTGKIISITKGKAVWKIRFEGNGGKGEVPKTIEIRKGFLITLPDAGSLNKENYKMVGWRANNETDKIYANESSYEPTEDTTFYAVWEEDTVKISFYSNTGTGEMENIEVVRRKNTKLPNVTFTKYGYSFKQWNTDAQGNGNAYGNGATISLTEDTTLYAIWDEDVIATLNISNYKITEGTTISLVGNALANGIQKVELKVGNTILYTENVNGTSNYNRSNLGINDLNGLANLNFNDITVVLSVTSRSGKVVSKNQNVKNYTIGNSNALNQFAQVVNNGNTLSGETIIQLQNIVTSNGYIPIGYYDKDEKNQNGIRWINTWTGRYFAGIYNGNNYYIQVTSHSNISNYNSHGIFGMIIGGTVKNLTVKGMFASGSFSGGIVGAMKGGSISNCRNESGDASGIGQHRGGIAGFITNSTFSMCANSGNIRGGFFIGGIVGNIVASSSSINSCYNTGTITAINKNEYGDACVGGIVGLVHTNDISIAISNCYNTGSISSTYSTGGGIVGVHGNNTKMSWLKINNCYNVGTISGPKNMGKLIGYAYRVSFSNCYILASPGVGAKETTTAERTQVVSSTDLKGMASTLGSSQFKTAPGNVNQGFPILYWQ